MASFRSPAPSENPDEGLDLIAFGNHLHETVPAVVGHDRIFE
ncbi:MAG: hypothetical protein M0017_12565 [Desulfobacteraceae bacterium]|nr:hypothetical protein [Desulfobacteraceae bacterium]